MFKKSKLVKNLSLFCLTSLLSYTYGQVDPTNVREGEDVEYCQTHKKMEALKKDPNFLKVYEKDQETLRQIEEQLKDGPQKRGDILRIPVVFHVLHDNGAENISDQQIYDAFYILNRDYRKRNADTIDVVPDFHSRIGDIEVEFSLATIAPDGTTFNGITRTESSETSSGDGQGQLQAIAQGNDVYKGQWDGNKYLNIFIARYIGGAAGYTTRPSNWSSDYMGNGIYCLSSYVGSIGTGSIGVARTLTHEVGHWLNLPHTWGSNNNPGNASSCGTDDGVSDTPNTIGVTSCALTEKTCGPLANVENFMDYSYCSKMFTEGQKSRMLAALNSSVGGRNNVVSSTNLNEVGGDFLITANFDATKSSLCNTGQLQFFDKSYNYIVSRSWNFPGATVTTSTKTDPIVEYTTPGIYPVQLTVSDGQDTKSVTKYIRVYGSPRTMPILDGFELYNEVGNTLEWEVYNQDNNETFEIVEGIGATGNKSIKLNNFNDEGSSLDELLNGNYDLSEVRSTCGVTSSFKYSYRKKVSSNTEKLQVLYSSNCGNSWDIRKTIQGNSLSSEVETEEWVPTDASHWKQIHLTNVTTNYWNSDFRFKFKFEGNGGNNLYLDDINVYASGPSNDPVGEEVEPVLGLFEKKTNPIEFALYPNPADQELNVSYNVPQAKNVQITVVDVLGKNQITEYIKSGSGSNLVVIPTAHLATGMYIVKLNLDGKEYTKQLMIK